MRIGALVVAVVLALAALVRADGPEPAKPGVPKTPDAAKKDDKAKAEPPQLPQRPAPKSLEEALRRLGNVRVGVAFKDAAFVDVVDYVRRASGMNVVVAPALQAKGLEAIGRVTLTLKDVTLRQLCTVLQQFSNTKLKFEGGIVFFTTPQDARGRPVLHIYAIGDLTMPLRNFPGPELDLRPANAEFTPEPESDVPSAWSDPQKVVEMIQKLCGDGTWSDQDVSISADTGKLVVRQYPEVHKEIARLLALLAANR
jgi:type II secretory pathway component GspD/PulD (secretin)